MDYEKTGKLIQELRKEKELTQKELSDKLGVTDRAVSNWERGKSFPDVSMLKPLAAELGVSVSELLDGERRLPDSDKVKLLPEGVATLTVEEADETAMKGIRTYIRETQRKDRVWMVIFLVAVLALILTANRVMQMRHSPIDFQEDNLNFDTIRVVMEDGSVEMIYLDDPQGEELKSQIQRVLREYMPEPELIGKLDYLPWDLKQGAHVELRKDMGRIIIYERAYYDRRSAQYYTHPYISQIHRMIYSMCCERLADAAGYRYEGETHFTCDGRTLDLECDLTERPMELIIDYFLEAMKDEQKVRYLFDKDVESYVIKSIVRMTPEEYSDLLEFKGVLGKEIPYRDLYDYRVYHVTFEFARRPGTEPGYQFDDGTYHYLFMAAKGLYEDDAYHIYPEYTNMFFPQESQ